MSYLKWIHTSLQKTKFQKLHITASQPVHNNIEICKTYIGDGETGERNEYRTKSMVWEVLIVKTGPRLMSQQLGLGETYSYIYATAHSLSYTCHKLCREYNGISLLWTLINISLAKQNDDDTGKWSYICLLIVIIWILSSYVHMFDLQHLPYMYRIKYGHMIITCL